MKKEQQIECQAEVDRLKHGARDERASIRTQPGGERIDCSRQINLLLDPFSERCQTRLSFESAPPFARGHLRIDECRALCRLHHEPLAHERQRDDNNESDHQDGDEGR